MGTAEQLPSAEAEVFESWPDEPVHEWYAVHTGSRFEKLVAVVLAAEHVPHLLPTIRVRKRWSDRYKYVTEPLFPGYLFVNIPIEERFPILSIRGVAKLIGFNGKPHPVPHAEIVAVRKATQLSLSANRHPALPVGCEVRLLVDRYWE